MNNIKKIIKKVLGERLLKFSITVTRYHRYTKNLFKTFKFAFIGFFKSRIPNANKCKGLQLKELLMSIKPKNIVKNGYVHFIDEYKIAYSSKRIIENATIDYEIFLNNSLNDLKK